MRRILTPTAVKNYTEAPPVVRKAFDKQMKFLINNLRYPSLHAKKHDEASNIWQARVNSSWRFYFLIQDDTYVILSIKSHPK